MFVYEKKYFSFHSKLVNWAAEDCICLFLESCLLVRIKIQNLETCYLQSWHSFRLEFYGFMSSAGNSFHFHQEGLSVAEEISP